MSKRVKNTGSQWTEEEVKELRALAKNSAPTRVIGLKLGRTENSVRSKASQKGISLKPTNQSPYGRKELMHLPKGTFVVGSNSKYRLILPPPSAAKKK